MSKYQLWSRDEYGQGSIIMTSGDINKVITRGKQEVTDVNVSNALTGDDRKRNWEAYMVMIDASSKKTTKSTRKRYVYAGGDPRTKDDVFVINANDKVETVSIGDIPNPKIKIYLGNISTTRKTEEDWFAKTLRGEEINSIDHQDLEGKIQFFVKKV